MSDNKNTTTKMDSTEKHGNKEQEYENADSGYLSGVVLSSSDNCDSGPLLDEKFSSKSVENQESMHISDSGIIEDGLGDRFSSLSLGKAANLNDFDAKFKSDKCEVKSQVPTVKIQAEKAPWEIYYQQDEEGNTQLHLSLLTGMRESCRAVIALSPHSSLLDVKNDRSQTALHLAVLTGQAEAVRLLAVAGAEVTVQDARGYTPLHLACRLGDILCVRALTDPITSQEYETINSELDQRFRELNQISASDEDKINDDGIGITKRMRCYQRLPQDLEQWTYDGEVCVHLAAREQHLEILRHLIWYGADINAREGKSGCTALHQAVKENNKGLVSFLLNEFSKILDLEIETYAGRTAYQLTDDQEIRTMLLNKGAIPLDNSDDESDSEDTEMSSSANKSTKYFQHFNNQNATINVA